ncbi:hypothetical protein BO71DRAFT_427025 [Aspergillus ellipticus CBS 707.79]|uniref:Xylanolytic transcriptional activator regulatory domain-containing protein n=1 Tax=Aspergillus ellipticus CBS 707.79 TaxID=1448320 RepID=A0A319DTU8_9EURO|nr:hypothetical protein BO71DRAFT_427025 [Aspergillus ellipticus CBS 707.79]
MVLGMVMVLVLSDKLGILRILRLILSARVYVLMRLFQPTFPQDGHRELHENHPLSYDIRETPTQECPTIFPSPQLALATQIIPHFASPNVTSSDRSRLLFSLGRIDKAFHNSNLPSTNALTRYLAGYFTGFYPHVPFTHAPTFELQSCSPELCLAMMAVGALDRFETTPATDLFHLSKALLFDSQQKRNRSETRKSMSSSGNENMLNMQLIDEVRCLLCLAQFATWHSDASLKTEACILQSLLGQSLRLSGLEEKKQNLEHLDWKQWAQEESERRTKLFAFCFLGLQSIAYDTPPIIWCDEVNLELPCSCPEWTAPDADAWALLQQYTPKEQERFHDKLEALLSSTYQAKYTTSPVANYVLIHGLLQKIVWTRRSMYGTLSLASSEDYEGIFNSALRRWTSCWQQTPESNLEPLDPNGPLPFISSALLSLAYVRNCSAVSPTRRIFTWEPTEIAKALRACPPVDRKWSSLLAAYQATNLLATLVKLGIQYFKHNQTILWSIEGALCGLDTSVFLEKWLTRVLDTMQDEPLTDHETRLIEWIQEVVYEGLSSANDCSIDKSARLSLLPDQIIVLWSHIMQGNSPFVFIKMIGEALVEYRQTPSSIGTSER